jgi:hypothetical protein
MALVLFGTETERRGQVLAMRLAATAMETRPFHGDLAELVTMFSSLVGCAECHGYATSLDFSDLLEEEVSSDPSARLVELKGLLVTQEDRLQGVHGALLVALFADEVDPLAASAVTQLTSLLDISDDLVRDVARVADAQAASAKADLFRRFLAERIAKSADVIGAHMDRHDLGSLTAPATIVEYHRLLASAPEGSLGAEMRAFYSDARFDIPGAPGAPLPIEFLGSHDVHHVLAGYNTTAQGEVYTAVFNAANASAGIAWLSVVLLQWHQGIKLGVFPEGHSHLEPAQMAEAAKRGAQTSVDVYSATWDWMALLDQPLDEVRAAIGIQGAGQVGPGQSWNPPSPPRPVDIQ